MIGEFLLMFEEDHETSLLQFGFPVLGSVTNQF